MTAMRWRDPYLSILAFLVFVSCGGFLASPSAAAEKPGWVAIESPHFTVLTNAEPARGAEISSGLERFRAVFARLAPELELSSPAPTRILAFRDAEAFAPYKAGADPAGGAILGQFLSHPDGNFITVNADPEIVGALAVIYHEYVHHLVVHNFPSVPLWFNEGLAEYYSTFEIEGSRARVGRPVERHLRYLAARRGELSLADVLAIDRRSIAEHDGAAVGEFYALSWLLVHRLLSGGGERLDQTADFFLRLEAGEDPERAFEAAYEVRLSQVEAELDRYLASGELPSRAIPLGELGSPGKVRARSLAEVEVWVHLGDLTARLGRPRQAADNYFRALELDPELADAHAGLGHLRDLEGRFGEAEVLHRDAMKLASSKTGSASARAYLWFGRHLLQSRSGSPEIAEAAALARDLLGQAVALEPNYAEALMLFGVAHLVGGTDPAPGLRALEKAQELAPARMDVALHRVRLLLHAGEIARARALVEGFLSARADPELVDRARLEVERAELLAAAEEAWREGEAERGLELYDRAISATADPDLRAVMEERLRSLQEQLENSR